MTEVPARPDIHVAPPLVFLAGFLAGVASDWVIVPMHLSRAVPLLALESAGLVLLALGLALALWAVVTFRRAKTTILPFRASSAMVRDGPYRFTRNPMYVGMTLGYVGASFLCDTGWPLIVLPLVLFALVKLVISREEKYLEALFGEPYRDYRRSVRRWV